MQRYQDDELSQSLLCHRCQPTDEPLLPQSSTPTKKPSTTRQSPKQQKTTSRQSPKQLKDQSPISVSNKRKRQGLTPRSHFVKGAKIELDGGTRATVTAVDGKYIRVHYTVSLPTALMFARIMKLTRKICDCRDNLLTWTNGCPRPPSSYSNALWRSHHPA